MECLNDSGLLKTPDGKGKRLLKSKSKVKLGTTPLRKRKKFHSFSGKHNSSFNTSRIVIENLNTNNRALKFEHQKVLNEIKLRTLKCNQVKEENEDLLLELPTLENVLNLTASEEKRQAVIDRKVEVYMQRLINLIGKSMKNVHQVLQSSTCVSQMLQVSNKIIDLPIIGDTEDEEFSFKERLGSILTDIKSGNDGDKIELDIKSHPFAVGLPQRILNAETPADEAVDLETVILSTEQKEDEEVHTNMLDSSIIQSPAAPRNRYDAEITEPPLKNNIEKTKTPPRNRYDAEITEPPLKNNIEKTKSPPKDDVKNRTSRGDSACFQGDMVMEHDTIDYSYTDMEMTEMIDASISLMVPPNTNNFHSNHKEQLSTTILESPKSNEAIISGKHSQKHPAKVNADTDNTTSIPCVQDSITPISPMLNINIEKTITPKLCIKRAITEKDENTTDNFGDRVHSNIKLVSETESSSEDTPKKFKVRSKRLNGSSRSKRRLQTVDYEEEDEEILIIPDSCKKKKPLRESPFLSQQQNLQEDTTNENMIKRPKRSKEPISYKERPINIKMRREKNDREIV